MFCGNIAAIVGVLISWMVEGSVKPTTLVLTAFSISLTLTFYQPELKELYNKIFNGNDDDFSGGSFG